ncbi:hypothetical protein GCM10010495_64450 [Kitasatospora herbaricolor]|uniref:hypothetical protein n=1 Tax=Kitasatospora TaxID=2063 RepID=UPI00174E73F9|nr:hypothetical protein [Kitasatospora herbaricolor]MDQ0305881.1 hypothetical protein [Kitasatospora herbaricolor]GGV38239.1 hypothetical protein GCM10010495_64450 [Kitasatospora herbaricolor]
MIITTTHGLSHHDRCSNRSTASYLRCYPVDVWQMASHVSALERYAGLLGLPTPVLFFDNGRTSSEYLPRLEALIAYVADGRFSTVMIPGMWVLSIHDREAQQRCARLSRLGCQIIALPERHPVALADHPVTADSAQHRNELPASRRL